MIWLVLLVLPPMWLFMHRRYRKMWGQSLRWWAMPFAHVAVIFSRRFGAWEKRGIVAKMPARACIHADSWFDRTFCAAPCGSMHDICTGCAQPMEGCVNDDERCLCCGRLPTLTPYSPYMNDYCDHCTAVRCDIAGRSSCNKQEDPSSPPTSGEGK